MLSIGSDDHVLVIWSAADYSLLIATQLESYINDVYWDPTVPYEFTTVGGAGIQFWMLDDVNNQLQLHQPQLPLATDECTVVCYSMNRYVYIGCVDGLVSVWSTTSNTCHFQWKTGCHDITSMCCNNERLVVGGANGIIQCWSINPSLSKPVAILQTSLQVVGGAYSTSFGKSLDYGVVGGASVYYIDWMNGSYHDILHHHHGNVSALCYSLDGRVMASCDVSGSLIVWDAVTWQSVTQFTTRNTSCTALAMIDRGGGAGQRQLMYVCGYSDGTIRVFDRHKVIHKVKVHQSPINKLMGIADGSGVLCGCGDGVAIAIDIFKGGLIMCKVSSHYGSSITDIDVKTFHAALPGTISANEEVWLIASNDQRVSLWNNGVLLDWLTFPTVRYKTAHDESSVMSPSLARFSPTQHDQIIYTGHTVDPCIQIYSISQKIIIKKLPLNYWATCMDLSMGGDVIALGSSNQVLTLMDVEGTFQESSTHCHTLSSLAFSPTCHQLVSTSQNYFHIWKL
jgi:WD40 repeat protein